MLSYVSIEVATCFFSCIFKFNYANDKKIGTRSFSISRHFIVTLSIYSCNCLSCFACDHALDKTMCIVVVSQILDYWNKLYWIHNYFFPWKLILNDNIDFIFIFLGLFYLAFHITFSKHMRKCTRISHCFHICLLMSSPFTYMGQ